MSSLRRSRSSRKWYIRTSQALARTPHMSKLAFSSTNPSLPTQVSPLGRTAYTFKSDTTLALSSLSANLCLHSSLCLVASVLFCHIANTNILFTLGLSTSGAYFCGHLTQSLPRCCLLCGDVFFCGIAFACQCDIVAYPHYDLGCMGKKSEGPCRSSRPINNTSQVQTGSLT
jgi:hypothetical protein